MGEEAFGFGIFAVDDFTGGFATLDFTGALDVVDAFDVVFLGGLFNALCAYALGCVFDALDDIGTANVATASDAFSIGSGALNLNAFPCNKHLLSPGHSFTSSCVNCVTTSKFVAFGGTTCGRHLSKNLLNS